MSDTVPECIEIVLAFNFDRQCSSITAVDRNLVELIVPRDACEDTASRLLPASPMVCEPIRSVEINEVVRDDARNWIK